MADRQCIYAYKWEREEDGAQANKKHMVSMEVLSLNSKTWWEAGLRAKEMVTGLYWWERWRCVRGDVNRYVTCGREGAREREQNMSFLRKESNECMASG